MKRNALLFAAAVAFCPLLAFSAPPTQTAPPPPGMNDPGVVANPANVPASASATAVGSDGASVQPAMPDTSPVRSKAARNPSAEQIIATSDSVIERKQGGDTVTEYRKNGLLRMVHVVSENGSEQRYVDQNGDGRLDRDLIDGPVSPVYFSLYQWD